MVSARENTRTAGESKGNEVLFMFRNLQRSLTLDFCGFCYFFYFKELNFEVSLFREFSHTDIFKGLEHPKGVASWNLAKVEFLISAKRHSDHIFLPSSRRRSSRRGETRSTAGLLGVRYCLAPSLSGLWLGSQRHYYSAAERLRLLNFCSCQTRKKLRSIAAGFFSLASSCQHLSQPAS